MRARDKRIARVQLAVDSSPVRRHVLREAYAWFKDFGELPDDDDHVAFEVVEQALRGGEEAPFEDEAQVADRARKAKLAYYERDRPGAAWPPSVRAFLFDEALFESPHLRRVARAAIAAEVARGGEVENRAFGARHGIPGYGSVGMHMCGWPRNLVVPPYESQAKRLLVRLDNIRGRVDSDDPDWFEAQNKAIAAFKQLGELPDDDLHFEAMLVNVELDQLIAHKHGKDVSEAMKLFDEVAQSEGEEQAEALKKLCEMAKAGRLF